MKVLAGIFFLASLFSSKETFAQTCFSGANVTATATSICSGDAVVMTLTAINGGTPVALWSANYQWQSSTTGVGGPWTNVGAPGTISSAGPVSATFNTSGLFANIYYQVVLTGIVGDCTVGTTTATSNVISITVNARPAAITGTPSVCVGLQQCLTDASAGGTWSSDDNTIATVGGTGCVFGVDAGTATIIYTLSGCSSTTVVTVNSTSNINGPTVVCQGSTITLTDATAGVTWSSSNGNATVDGSGDVTGVAGGTTIITATSPLGCNATTVITVNPLPAGITGNTDICIGLTNCLTDASAGGTWSSSNNAVASVSTAGCVTGSTTGNATITYTLATGCLITTTVTVNPLPTPILGTATVCQGSTTVLTDATAGGTWTSSDPSIAPVTPGAGNVSGALAGTATITYTLPTGCIATVVVTVNAYGPITGNLNVCQGGTSTLTDAATGGIWSSSNPAIGSVGSSTGVVTGITLGNVIITYTLPFGCVATASVTVDQPPSAISGASTVCVGATISLSDVPGGGTWSSSTPTVAIIDPSTGIVTGVSNGTTTITYTLPTGCTATTVIAVNPVAPITGPTSLCVAPAPAGISLTDATPGGAWSSTSPGIASIDAFGNVTGISAGTTTISYLLPSGCSATTVITVNPLPAPISGTLSVCEDGGVTCLTDASAGGVWSSSLVVIAPTGCATGYATGVGTVTYTLPTGCMTISNVTVNPLPAPITGNNTVCVGFTTMLSDVSPGGTWSSVTAAVGTVGSTTGVVTGLASGSTEIIYTLATGCTADTLVTVLPVPNVITGTTIVCQGSVTSLTDVTAGGTWSSSTGGVATVDGSGNVTGVSGGTTTITYTIPSGCFTTVVVTVNPLPAPITGPGTVCMGNTISLGDITGGGTWSSTNTAVGTVDVTGDVTGITAGTTTISYTINTGCAATLIVTVNSLFAITGNVEFCVGQSIMLSDAAPGGTWSSVNPGIASVDAISGTVTGTGPAGGTTTIVYTLPTGCSANVIVTVNPAPLGITGGTTVCAGLTTNLTDATAGGNWSSSDPTIAQVGATGIVTGIAGGTATITYQIGSGCIATTIVTVYPFSQITGNPNVCFGQTTSLTDATAGGTWGSINTGVATVGTDGTVTGVSVDTTTIFYSLPTGCEATVVVTVNPLAPITGGNTILCVGNTLTLSDAAVGGIWTSSNTGIASVGSLTGIVTGGPGTGIVTITYTLPTGCVAYTTLTINSLSAITGPTSVCVGSQITLNEATAGGVWSSSNPAIGSIDPLTGIVTGVAAGAVIITYTYGANCWAIYSVIVNPMSPIVGTFSLCPGLCTSLTDATIGGIWTSSDITIATIGSTTGIVCGVASGTAVITYTVPTGCSATAIVTVNTVLPLTGNPSLCLGGTTALTDAVTGGTWSSSNTAVATVDASGNVTSAGTVGTSNITYTLPSTGCVAVITVTVNPLPAPITGPNQICAYGGTAQLSDATAGGVWSSFNPTVGSTGIITGEVPGTGTVTYTLPTGCAAYYIITINPLPTLINGNLVVCQGLSSTLSDTTLGGTWSSSVPAIGTIGSATGIVTGINPGTTVVTYTLATGCYVDTVITINPNPLPINGTLTVCVGLTTALTDATGGGVWSSSTPAIGSINPVTGIVTGIAPGTTTITYTLLTGCLNTVVVTVNPNPTAILGAGSVCVGQTITLSDLTAGGNWSSSNGNVTIDPVTGLVTGASAGTATITYTLATGCIITDVITVNPLSPITGTPSLCVGLTTSLSDATAGGTWSSSTGAIGTVDPVTGIVTGIAAGTTTISYIMPSGCTSTIVVTVYALPTPISGTLSVCVGQTTSVSDGTVGGTWSSSNGDINIGSSTGIILGVTAGTSTITYTLGTGCIITAVVTVNPLAPISGVTNLCESQVTTVSDAVGGGTWSSSNGNVSVDGSGNVTAISVGTSVISYILPSGCTTTLTVTVNILGAISGTTELCVGTSTVFTDPVLGGLWNSSNTAVATVNSITGTVTGITPGTSIISYTLPSGCTATIIVTVAALSPITGPSSVCQGDSIALTDATPSGIWSSSNTGVATVSTTGEVNGGHSGTAIISYSYGPGCVAIHSVIVNPATPILGNLNVCQGLTTHLSDSTLGGTWSISPTTIAVINPSGTVTGIDVGTAIVSYTLPTGCVITAIVTVNVTNAIQGADSVCVGLTTALTDATAGVTWTSSLPGVGAINAATGVLTGVSAGTTTVTATSPLGCTATVVVTVNPLPSAILGTPVVCQGLTITLSDLTPLGTWSSSNTSVATVSAAGVVTGVLTGSTTSATATITYTLPTSCITTIVVTVNPLPLPITGNLVVCQGSSTDLSDATGGGTWSITPTTVATVSATGVVTGVAGGTATVTYTLGTGCIITAIVTVNPLPNPISGNPNICIGTTVCYSDGTAGGTWASSNPAVGSISVTGCVAGLTLGTTTITYDLTATGCLVTLTVTVDPLPTPILGADSVCVGLCTSLSDATPGGTWTSSNPVVETIGLGTGLACGITAGVVTDTYTLFSTGCFVTTTVTVNPLPLPINGNFSVCFGTCNTLTDANPGGTWSSSNVVVAPIGSATGVVCGNVLGTATITYTLPTGCIITQVITVNPLPAPITGSVPICVGYSITLSDITPGGTWTSSLPDTASVGLNTGVVDGLHSGTTTITYELTATGCIATTIVTVNPLPGPIITGQNTVCLHDSVVLSDAFHGGSWSSSNPGVGSISPYALSDTTVTIIGEAAGGVLITYTSPAGCFVTDSITVFPLPPAITGPSVVCVNSFITLSDASVGGTWSDSPVDTANINSVTGILTGIHSGTVVVTYTSNQGCTVTTVITVNPIPAPITGIDMVCNGFSTALTDASTGGVWSVSDTSIDAVSVTGVVTGKAPGADTIFYTFPVTGCNVPTTFTVNPIPVITVAVSPNATICIGGSAILTASGAATAGVGPGTYTWAPPTALSSTIGSPVTASPIETTTYTVTGTTVYGCSSDTTVTVHVDSLLLHVHISGRDSICAGDADTLIASGYSGSLFKWTPVTTGLSCTICDTTIARIVNTTTYTAVAIDTLGCKYTASFTVTVNPLPIIKVSPNPTIVCQGSSTQLTASGAATYTWFPNAFLSCDNCPNPIASDTQNLVYNVIGTSIYGCRDSVTVPVSVLDTTKLTISDDTIICLGQSAQLIATSTSADGSHPEFYSWSPAAGLSNPNSPIPVATPDTTTQYSVTIKENFCFTRVENVTVYVEPQPTIVISTSATNVSAGSTVQLSASISNEVLVSNYIWTPADGLSCDRCFAPIATPTVTTTYTFTATSNYGCTSNADVTVTTFCDQSQVFIPNTFTPNGDGVNDRFYISAHGVSLIVRLSVYNRWGELVFQSLNSQPNDAGAGWDGTYKGQVLAPDVFVYVAEVLCDLGQQPFSFKGDVSIVR